MKYYHESKDRFDPILHGSYTDVTDNTAYKPSGRAQSIFLSNVVSNGVHQWRFRADTIRERFGICFIGIWNNEVDTRPYLDKLCCTKGPEAAIRGKVFGLNCARGQLRGDADRDNQQYCPKCNDNDIVDMYLDFNNMELKYSVNNKDYGKAFNIPEGSYRASISLYWKNDKVTLVFYHAK